MRVVRIARTARTALELIGLAVDVGAWIGRGLLELAREHHAGKG
jgi:hypothetical protein